MSIWSNIFPAKSFKAKLVFSYILVIFLSFGFIAIFLNVQLREHALQELNHSLTDQALLVENQLSREQIVQKNITALYPIIKELGTKVGSRLTVIDTQGKVLADSERTLTEISSMENHAGRPEVKEALEGRVGKDIRYSETLKINMLYVALPIKENVSIVGAVRIALPLDNVKKMLGVIRNTVILSLLFALCIALLSTAVMTNTLMRPINRMLYVCRKFAKGDFNHRINVYPKDEIGELAATLDTMAQAIEEKIKAVAIQGQQLKAAFEQMAEGIIVVDKKGQIISLNPAAERIFNVMQSQAEGKLLLESIPNSDIASIIAIVMEKRELISREVSLVWPVNKIFKINASPIYEHGEVSSCLLVIHDITDMRRLETMRRDFVANVSHELKTPLTSIKGFVETLLEGALDDTQHSRHFLEIIKDHTDRLDTLINDLLSLSYLESKEAVLRKEQFSLAGLADKVLLGFQSQLRGEGIRAENAIPKALSIVAEKNKIEQVFTNLIDNAIKFNKETGLVRVLAEEAGDKIKVTVEDTGVGIPEKDLPRIFERFYRVDKARSRSLGGTGLGLSIVKHIIELHGGRLGVESTEGLGSKFWFTLPR